MTDDDDVVHVEIRGFQLPPDDDSKLHLTDMSAFAEHISNWSNGCLVANGELQPMIIALDAEANTFVLSLKFPDQIVKQATYQAAKEWMQEKRIVRYAMVAEAWMADYTDGSDPDVAPADRESKREIVVLVVVDQDGEQLIRFTEISMDEKGKRSLGDLIPAPDSDQGGAMTSLLSD